MSLVKVYVSLGSNLNDPVHNLIKARYYLETLGCVINSRASSTYWTEPQEKKDQPWFANQVLELTVRGQTSPLEFWKMLANIETKMGRIRKERYGPRSIDLDVLLFGQEKINLPELVIPHPKMFKRAFVLVPLKELIPYVLNRPIDDYLQRLHFKVTGQKIWQT